MHIINLPPNRRLRLRQFRPRSLQPRLSGIVETILVVFVGFARGPDPGSHGTRAGCCVVGVVWAVGVIVVVAVAGMGMRYGVGVVGICVVGG